jgi:hypothetical protein
MSKLKAKYTSLEDIPENFRDLFEPRGESEKGAGDGFYVLTNIEGIDTEGNVVRLESALAKSKKENKLLKERLESAGGGKTPDEIHALEDKVQELEAQLATAGKPDEEKINNLVEARVKTRVGPVERELKTTREALEKEQSKSQELSQTITRATISDAARKAATKANIVPHALDDFLMRAERVFEIVDLDGKQKIVTRDQVGVTPGLDPEGYLSEIGPSVPHWFQASQGAGSRGGVGAGMNGSNPWAENSWNMTEQGNVIKSHGIEKAEKLAKDAGSFIGATGPAKKGK